MLDLVASTWHSVTPDDEQRWSLLKMLPDVEQVRIKIFRFRRQGACPLQGLFDEFHRGKPGYFVDASREMMIDRVAEALPAELTPWQTALFTELDTEDRAAIEGGVDFNRWIDEAVKARKVAEAETR
ncbi:TPA: hypothetical protein DEA21_02370 [Candidatus Uhrbacteria bacterium]|nr:hypothetical protein [Candidatus Uhrbacteria bacterium]